MSQNKTVIQGLEPSDNIQSAPVSGGNQGFYSRGSRPAARGTVVPGMESNYSTEVPLSQPANPQPRRNAQSGKPVVGFLYSISRTPFGEYWPIYMGRNTIGQTADNDIQLTEGTVSSSHAVIVTRQVKSGIIAAITDAQSTNGTQINGETIGFTPEECRNGDIITIGNNYQFLLTLIDAPALGLAVSKDFIPVNAEAEEDIDDGFVDDIPSFTPGGDGVTRTGGGFDPFAGGYTPNDGTVGMNGQGNVNHGGTVSM